MDKGAKGIQTGEKQWKDELRREGGGEREVLLREQVHSEEPGLQELCEVGS